MRELVFSINRIPLRGGCCAGHFSSDLQELFELKTPEGFPVYRKVKIEF